MRIGILGGGALGLTAGYRLAQAGHRVELIEREPIAGGLAAGLRIGDSYLEKFYHHIFRTDRTAIAYIGELGLADKLLWLRPDTSVLANGRVWSLDSAGDVLRFGPLGPPDRLRLGAGLALLKLLPSPGPLAQQTAAAWLRRWMGSATFDRIWRPLLRGKFHDHADEVSMAWFWARIHDRTPDLGYLRGGFQHLYDRLAARIGELGGEVLLGCAATAIHPEPSGEVRVELGPDARSYDRLLVTLPTRVFLRLAPDLPDDYRRRYESPTEHLSAHCLILALDRQLTDGVYWLNVNDPGFPFLSLVEHTNLMPPGDYGGRHLVYLGNYLPADHPVLSRPKDELLATYLPHLARINPAFEASWVTDSWSVAAPYAQPIVRVGYPATLPPHRTPLPGVFLANMGHVYPHDRGQNYSLLLGETVARLVGDA